MIERQFISRKVREFEVQKKLASELNRSGYNKITIRKTPLGEKITVHTTKPGLIVGKKGENIIRLIEMLKKDFGMENPQIEVSDIENPSLDSTSVAEKIKSVLESKGSKRFKAISHGSLSEMMNAGALGAEVVISGKVPSARAKTWRFKEGHLKKSGDISQNHIDIAYAQAILKTGMVGIKVSLMHPELKLPDKVLFKTIEESKGEKAEKPKEKKAEESKEENKEVQKAEKKSGKKKTKKIEENKKESKEENKEVQKAEKPKEKDGNNKK